MPDGNQKRGIKGEKPLLSGLSLKFAKTKPLPAAADM